MYYRIIRPFASVNSERIPIPNEESEFSYFFKPVLAYANSLYWLCLPDSFRIPQNWHDESIYSNLLKRYIKGPMMEFHNHIEIIKGGPLRKSYHLLAPPGILLKYANIINDDWNRLLGFCEKPDNMRKWAENYWKLNPTNRATYIKEWVDLGISNCDGAYWEIYTSHEDIIDLLQKYWSTIIGLKVEEGDLEKSYGI